MRSGSEFVRALREAVAEDTQTMRASWRAKRRHSAELRELRKRLEEIERADSDARFQEPGLFDAQEPGL